MTAPAQNCFSIVVAGRFRSSSIRDPRFAFRDASSAFTLLELIVSLSLMVSIVLLGGMAMRLGYRCLAQGQEKMDSLERVRTSVTIMNAQIQSAMPLLPGEDASTLVQFDGAEDSLRVATSYSAWGGQTGPVAVEYRVVAEGDKQCLRLTEKAVRTGKQREATLFRGYTAIRFEYLGESDPELEEEWRKEWSDPAMAPQKVKLLLLSGRSRSVALTIPVRVQEP